MPRLLLVVALMGFTLGCANLFRRDHDRDGYFANVDCDDENADVHPDAVEVCDPDNADEDCNGVSDDQDPAPGGLLYYYVDSDSDGWGVAGSASVQSCDPPAGYGPDGDCAEGDASVHPGADEHCDDEDEDCDGATDEDPVDGSLWYLDEDGDGYGKDEVRDCDRPSGAVSQGGDCDDADALTSPGAEEICDTIDNDCDGLVDGDDPDADMTSGRPWYRDQDGDGYGDPDSVTESCEQPSGHVSNSEDCDDGDDGVNPDATEICDNGADENCDGGAPECAWGASMSVGDADVTYTGTATAGLGSATVAAVPDWSGDGADELVVSMRDGDTDGYGLVLAWTGVPEGTLTQDDASTVIECGKTTNCGFHSPSGGDLDGDGQGDLVLGKNWYSRLVADVYLGPPPALTDDDGFDARFWNYDGYSQNDLLVFPDHDGSGADELVISEPGVVWVLERATLPGENDIYASAYASFQGAGNLGYGEMSVCKGGDVFGDGGDDLIAGALQAGEGNEGAVYVIDGPFTSGLAQDVTEEATIAGTYDGGGLYACTDGGDVNGDGYADVFVAQGYRNGVYGFYGPIGNVDLDDADVRMDWTYFFALAPDANGDGGADLALGEDGLYVFWGSSLAGTLEKGDADVTVSLGRDQYALPAWGDFDGNGVSDLVGYHPSFGTGDYGGLAIWYAAGP